MTPAGKILIVEDDPDIRESLAAAFDEEGYAAEQAGNGAEALEILAHGSPPPRLIVLDLMMPVMDGFEFRSRQRSDPALADIPVLIVTAGSRATEAQRTLAPVGVLKKPFNLEDVLRVVKRLCA